MPTPYISYGLVNAYLENPADFPKIVYIWRGSCRNTPQLIYNNVSYHMKQAILITFFLAINVTFGQKINIDLTELDKSASLSAYIDGQFQLTLENYYKEQTPNNKIVKRPLIIMNQTPISDQRMLDLILLKDINEMRYIVSGDRYEVLYGTAVRYGILNVEMNKAKWKKIKRKYGS